jgi:hypothetical protein
LLRKNQRKGIVLTKMTGVIVLSTLALLNFGCGKKAEFFEIPESTGGLHGRLGPYTVGTEEQNPHLKFFFLVDNSQTMKDEQIRMKQSFQAMFIHGAHYLEGFDTTAYVFSTSQITPSDDDFDDFDYLFPTHTVDQIAQNYSYAQLMGPGGPRDIAAGIGLVPGDVIGYQVKSQNIDGRDFYDYIASPVSLFKAPQGDVHARPMIPLKGSCLASQYGETSCPSEQKRSLASFIEDFNDRIDLLAPENYDLADYDFMTSRESGLCGMARILKHSEQYLNVGDQPIFVIVSDENDTDFHGGDCIDSRGYQEHSRIDCEVKGTQFEYREQDECRYQYRLGTYYEYEYRGTNVYYKECIATDDDPCGLLGPQQVQSYEMWPGGQDPESMTPEQCGQLLGIQHQVDRCDNIRIRERYNSVDEIHPFPSACTSNIISSLRSNYITGTCKFYSAKMTGRIEEVPTSGNCDSYCQPSMPECTASLVPGETEQRDFEASGLTCSSLCTDEICAYGFEGKTIRYFLENYRYTEAAAGSCRVSQSSTWVKSHSARGGAYIPKTDYESVCPVQPGVSRWSFRGSKRFYSSDVLVKGEDEHLKAYIENRAQQLQDGGIGQVTIANFVNLDTPAGPGESRGTQHMQMGHALNGSGDLNFDIHLSSYEPALALTTQFVQERLTSIFQIAVPEGTEIRIVFVNDQQVTRTSQYPGWAHEGDSLTLQKQLYTSEGVITLQAGDKVEVEYW